MSDPCKDQRGTDPWDQRGTDPWTLEPLVLRCLRIEIDKIYGLFPSVVESLPGSDYPYLFVTHDGIEQWVQRMSWLQAHNVRLVPSVADEFSDPGPSNTESVDFGHDIRPDLHL